MATTPRTSQSHPLQIASVQSAPGHGRIGITFCPGKKQPTAMTGGWDRDLGLDVEAIAEWGAAAVITLMEPREIEALGVQPVGQEIAERHMDWLHLPIPDVSIPGPEFEAEWAQHGE